MQISAPLRTSPLVPRATRDLNGGNTVGLVPTMGALHAGHASLIRAARASCTHVAVSLFVNPTQFGPNEDYARYPRAFEADCALAEAEGADVLFAPTVEELYPNGRGDICRSPSTERSSRRPVPPRPLSRRRHGGRQTAHRRRAGLRLLRPEGRSAGCRAAPHGCRSALATEIVVCPIVRDADGLALSSRNAYLSPAQRAQALTLSRAVRHVESLVAQGERRASVLIASARGVFRRRA
jgi:pantoate--beta-alanine ligase